MGRLAGIPRHTLSAVFGAVIARGSGCSWEPVKTAAGRRHLPLLGIARDALTRQSNLRVVGELP